MPQFSSTHTAKLRVYVCQAKFAVICYEVKESQYYQQFALEYCKKTLLQDGPICRKLASQLGA